ncbi:hypothetical protein FXO37_24129 [Capsicum annuum]|nr:hypothetical protein FXO37_24129 [Capsicum annuum]
MLQPKKGHLGYKESDRLKEGYNASTKTTRQHTSKTESTDSESKARRYCADILIPSKDRGYCDNVLIPNKAERYCDDILIHGKAKGYYDKILIPDKARGYCDDIFVPIKDGGYREGWFSSLEWVRTLRFPIALSSSDSSSQSQWLESEQIVKDKFEINDAFPDEEIFVAVIENIPWKDWSTKLDDALWAYQMAFKIPIGEGEPAGLHNPREWISKSSLRFRAKFWWAIVRLGLMSIGGENRLEITRAIIIVALIEGLTIDFSHLIANELFLRTIKTTTVLLFSCLITELYMRVNRPPAQQSQSVTIPESSEVPSVRREVIDPTRDVVPPIPKEEILSTPNTMGVNIAARESICLGLCHMSRFNLENRLVKDYVTYLGLILDLHFYYLDSYPDGTRVPSIPASSPQAKRGTTGGFSTKSTRVGKFMMIGPLSFTGGKVEDNPQVFLDEMEKGLLGDAWEDVSKGICFEVPLAIKQVDDEKRRQEEFRDRQEKRSNRETGVIKVMTILGHKLFNLRRAEGYYKEERDKCFKYFQVGHLLRDFSVNKVATGVNKIFVPSYFSPILTCAASASITTPGSRVGQNKFYPLAFRLNPRHQLMSLKVIFKFTGEPDIESESSSLAPWGRTTLHDAHINGDNPYYDLQTADA